MDPSGVLCLLIGLGVLAVCGYGLYAAIAQPDRWRRVEELEREVRALRGQVLALEQRVGGSPVPAAPPETAPLAARLLSSRPNPARTPAAAPVLAPDGAAAARLPATPCFAPAPPPPISPAVSAGHPEAPASDTSSLEERIGGQWLGWLGAVTVAVTAALAIAWAYREGWITPLIILSAGWLLGVGLLAASEYLRRRLPLYGQGLAGAGVAVLYVTTYAGHAGYGTLSAGEATLGLIAVGALAIASALRHDSAVIGWLGIVLAYASPVMFRSSATSPAPLFLYVTGLNAVVLGISVARRWVPFRAAAFAATALLYAIWHWNSYAPALMPEALAFVGANWAIFLAVTALYPLLRGEATSDSDLAVAALNPLAAGLAYYAMLHAHHSQALAFAAAACAGIYYLAARALRARRGTEDYLEQLFFSTALVLALLVVPLLFKARAMAAAWAMMGAALTVVGYRTGSQRTCAWGGVALFLALGRLAVRDAWLAPVAGSPAFFNERGFSFAVVALAFGAAAAAFAHRWRCSGEQDLIAEGLLATLAAAAAAVVTVWVALDAPAAWITPAWCVVSGLMLLFGWQLRSCLLRTVGLAFGLPSVLIASGGPSALAAIASSGPGAEMWPARLSALALAGGAAYAFERFRTDRVAEGERAVTVPLTAAAGTLVALTWSAADLGRGWVPLVWMAVALLLLWTAKTQDRLPLRMLGLLVTAALTAEVLLRELLLPGGYPLLLNSRSAAALALVTAWGAAAWVLYRSGTDDEREVVPALLLVANLALLGWISLEVGEAARRVAGAGDASRLSLSAVWILYAAGAIGLGLWKRLRMVRWGGMALLLVAVLKVYLIDLASLALEYRVISFLVLALVLLGVSFIYQRRGTPAG